MKKRTLTLFGFVAMGGATIVLLSGCSQNPGVDPNAGINPEGTRPAMTAGAGGMMGTRGLLSDASGMQTGRGHVDDLHTPDARGSGTPWHP